MKKIPTILCLLFGVSIVTGCANTPAPNLYFLDHDGTEAFEIKFRERVGLAEITLPAYARKEKIASLSDRFQIIQDDRHRWAEPPETAVSVAFTRALELRLSRTVLLQPYPRSIQPALQIKIVFDRFLRGLDSQAEMSGQYLLMNGKGSKTLAVVRFQYTVPADTDNYQGYMGAVVKGIRMISDRIANDVEERH